MATIPLIETPEQWCRWMVTTQQCSAYGLYLIEYRLMYQGIHYNVTSTIYIQYQICFQPTRRIVSRQ